MASVKALVQVDFPVHALSEHSQTLMKKQSVKKMAKFKTLSICQKVLLWHPTSSCKCSTCLHCVCYAKYQMASVKALEGVDFSHMYYLAPFRITKGSDSKQNWPLDPIIKVYLADIKVFEKFDEFQLLPFQDIKEKPKHHGRMERRTERQTMWKQNIVCGGYNNSYLCRAILNLCMLASLNLLIIILLRWEQDMSWRKS